MTPAPHADPSPAAAPPKLEEFRSLPHADIVERFARGSSRLDRRLLDLDNARLDTFFRPEAGVGRWSCRVLVGHVADADLSFVHRMRRTVAEDHPVLAAWDENAFIDSGLYHPHLSPPSSSGRGPGERLPALKPLPVAGSVAVIHTLRLWCADWLRTLSGGDFARTALHPERGELSVRTILDYATWHLEHHAWFLDRKIERLNAPAG